MRDEFERAVLDWARRRPDDGARAIARGLGMPSRYGVVYDVLRRHGLETAAKRRAAAAASGGPGEAPASGTEPAPSPSPDATDGERDRPAAPFDELGLAHRWRLQPDEMLPRTAPPLPPPGDPLAAERPPSGATEADGAAPSGGRGEGAGKALARPALRARLPRPAFRLPSPRIRARGGTGVRTAEPASEAGRGPAAEVGPRPLPDAVRHELLAFVGALPRAGTTTALCAWALAQAEAGAHVALVDAADRPAVPAMLWGRVARAGWETALGPGELQGMAVRDPELPLDVWPRGWDPTRVADDPERTVRALGALLAAARRSGAVTVAFDLGSFPPLPGGRPDPRLAWATGAGAAVVLVVPGDLFGVDAAARFVAALDGLGRPAVVRLLLAGPDSPGGLSPDELAAVVGGGAGQVRVASAARVPWDPTLADAAGRGRVALRLLALGPGAPPALRAVRLDEARTLE